MASDPRQETEVPETGPEREETGDGSPVTAAGPFDPTDIRVETATQTIDQLAKRITDGGIDLESVIARDPAWNEAAQSRVIESVLVRLPLPAFYFDAADKDRWLVIDGLRRLSALDGFINAGAFNLTGLEYLDNLEGKDFKGLPRHFQRRILETQVTAHLVQEGTPDAIRLNLFRRFNTGARTLSDQEIRDAMRGGPVDDDGRDGGDQDGGA